MLNTAVVSQRVDRTAGVRCKPWSQGKHSETSSWDVLSTLKLCNMEQAEALQLVKPMCVLWDPEKQKQR